MNIFNRCMLVCLLFITTGILRAQDQPPANRQTEIRVLPLYQQWSIGDTMTLSETSSILQIEAPLSTGLSVSVSSARAGTGGSPEGISGFTDTQLGLRYNLPDANLSFTLAMNLPSGQHELSSNEFATASLLAVTPLNFQIRTFGQGWNINPGFLWALPLSRTVAAGVGLSYLLHGSFTPLAGSEVYSPGNELLLTSGIDLQLTPSTIFSLDGLVTVYGKDKIANKEVFSSGTSLITTAQIRNYFGRDEFQAALRYRSKSKNEFLRGFRVTPDEEKLIPNQLDVLSKYRWHTGDLFTLGMLLSLTSSEETEAAISGIHTLGFGIEPEYVIGDAFRVTGQVIYYTGSLKDDKKLAGSSLGLALRFSL